MQEYVHLGISIDNIQFLRVTRENLIRILIRYLLHALLSIGSNISFLEIGCNILKSKFGLCET